MSHQPRHCSDNPERNSRPPIRRAVASIDDPDVFQTAVSELDLTALRSGPGELSWIASPIPLGTHTRRGHQAKRDRAGNHHRVHTLWPRIAPYWKSYSP